MTIWITKYALSKGIYTIEVNGPDTTYPTMVVEHSGTVCHHKPYWHTSKEEAVAHAAQMRAKKIASLTKQVDKLYKMNLSE